MCRDFRCSPLERVQHTKKVTEHPTDFIRAACSLAYEGHVGQPRSQRVDAPVTEASATLDEGQDSSIPTLLQLEGRLESPLQAAVSPVPCMPGRPEAEPPSMHRKPSCSYFVHGITSFFRVPTGQRDWPPTPYATSS
jgi:hypothetical protein